MTSALISDIYMPPLIGTYLFEKGEGLFQYDKEAR